MTEPVTKQIHCRLTHDGTLHVCSDDDIDSGTTLDDFCAHEDDGPFRDFVVEICARPPAIDPPVVGAVVVPDEAPPEVTASAQASAA